MDCFGNQTFSNNLGLESSEKSEVLVENLLRTGSMPKAPWFIREDGLDYYYIIYIRYSLFNIIIFVTMFYCYYTLSNIFLLTCKVSDSETNKSALFLLASSRLR